MKVKIKCDSGKFDFSRDVGVTVDIDVPTLQRWKRGITEWDAVQKQMSEFFQMGEPEPVKPPEMTQPSTVEGETVAFASMGNLKFSDPNVTVSPNEPKQPVGMSIQPAPSVATADVRQESNPVQAKRRGRPPKKAQEDKVGVA